MMFLSCLNLKVKWADPRASQLLAQWSLLVTGVLVLDFSLQLTQILLTLATAIATQRLLMSLFRIQRGYWSAMITALGIVLLLRADNLWLHPIMAILAIISKFTLHLDRRPIFNAANLAVVIGGLLPGGWISAAQWGYDWWMLGLIATLGLVNIVYTQQWASTVGFLGTIALILGLRFFWLGEPLSIFLHHLYNGSLWLFAFFMITDPRTTPKTHIYKMIFGGIIASLHIAYQFVFWQPHGALYALVTLSLIWAVGVKLRKTWQNTSNTALLQRYSWSMQAQDWADIRHSAPHLQSPHDPCVSSNNSILK